MIVMAGSLGNGYQEVYQRGIDVVVPILDKPMRFEESVSRTYDLLRSASERTMRLLKVAGQIPRPKAPFQ